MSIYKRYFRVTSGTLLQAIEQIESQRKSSLMEIKKLQEELEATDTAVTREGSIYGFKFQGSEPDPKIWKMIKQGGYFFPKKNTNKGKEIAKKIKSISKYPDHNQALEDVGLVPNFPALIDFSTGVGISSQVFGSYELGVWFVSVPWQDEAPEVLSKYQEDRAKGTRMSCALDHLLWEPPSEFVEVKRWEMEKEIEELNYKLRERRNSEAELN